MTRGQIAIITPEGKILTSIEFNGDMYYSGYGQEVFEGLELVESIDEYKELVEDLNRENFGYKEELFYECPDSFLDMSDDYFGKWFSDYVYIKNLSDKTVIFTDAEKQRVTLEPEATLAFYFGRFYASDTEDFENREFIEELETLRSKLCDHSASENYSNIWNACADFDNGHRGFYLTDRIQEQDFVTEDVLEYIVKKNATELSRLRCFINDTYEDDIYRLDGYGNLANVNDDDFEDLLDLLVEEVGGQITPPIAMEAACL